MPPNYSIHYNETSIFVHYEPQGGNEWIKEWYLGNNPGEKLLCRIFNIKRENIDDIENLYSEDEGETVTFTIGRKIGGYYVIEPPVLSEKYSLKIKEGFEVYEKFFSGIHKSSAIKALFDIVEGDIIIGDEDGQISRDTIESALKKYPTSIEVTHYINQRLASIMSTEIELKKDYEKRYERYLIRRNSSMPPKEYLEIQEYDLEKYQFILDKMKDMLSHQDEYDETAWQKIIVKILCLIFPQYIFALREQNLTELYGKDKKVDYVLINSSGYVDLMEIKHPRHDIIAKTEYRNNIIPSRDLTGAICQIENYLYNLNRKCENLANAIKKRIEKEITGNFEVKILNPRGLIIAGYSPIERSDKERTALEIIRRQYSHVADVITYNDLIERLENTIYMIEKDMRKEKSILPPNI